MTNKAFQVGDYVMFQCRYTQEIKEDQIIYLSPNIVGGANQDLTELYIKGKLTKVNK